MDMVKREHYWHSETIELISKSSNELTSKSSNELTSQSTNQVTK